VFQPVGQLGELLCMALDEVGMAAEGSHEALEPAEMVNRPRREGRVLAGEGFEAGGKGVEHVARLPEQEAVEFLKQLREPEGFQVRVARWRVAGP